LTVAQQSDAEIDALLDAAEDTAIPAPLCFGIREITDSRAVSICDALYLNENVKARELADNWVRMEPDHPGAQFALAEVMFSVEANLPRALYHLNLAESLTNYSSLGRALASGFLEWHYLTLSQLSYVHQLMGDQVAALSYLEKLESIYGQDVESFRGWPLIKLKEYEAARASANLVLQESDDERARARAWNTLCAVELASLQPKGSLVSCDRAIDEDEDIAAIENDSDTVYLVNASEVSLSLLKIEEAEAFLDRAARFPNPESVANPWVYKLYLTMNQGRLDEARQALDSMLLWRENQVPVVGVMNRAEHLLAAAMFLVLSGYGEDAARLATTAMNEPDRNGSFSADDDQKDALAALVTMIAHKTAYQAALEASSSLGFLQRSKARLMSQGLRISAWRAERRAASLFADQSLMLNRFRPYAPLDVHIPEWVEHELISLMGTGISSQLLDQARSQGAFLLNEGYFHAYATEVSFLRGDHPGVLENGLLSLPILPEQEVLLRARLQARMADASLKTGQIDTALQHFESALQLDPGIIRRLGTSIPVSFRDDGSRDSRELVNGLRRSPRFQEITDGFPLEVRMKPEPTACLYNKTGRTLGCYTLDPTESVSGLTLLDQMIAGLHRQLFTPGYELSEAQIALLLGSSVIMSAQQERNRQRDELTVLQ
jgi:tetratricopeptide (TPR) repeat protein